MRRASRKDLLHVEVGRLFRTHGYDTLDTSLVGDGCPDWFMARDLLAFMVEVKTPKTWQSSGDRDKFGRNENQIDFHRKWKSRIYIVTSIEEGQQIITAHRHSGTGP